MPSTGRGSPEDLDRVEERDELAGLLGIDDPRARHAPALGDAELALVVGPAFLGAGDLDRARPGGSTAAPSRSSAVIRSTVSSASRVIARE